MAKQKIIAIYMLTDSGGVGTESRLSLMAGRDRVDFEDAGATVKVVIHPPRTMAAAKGGVQDEFYEVPKSAMRCIRYETPAQAEEREQKEKGK